MKKYCFFLLPELDALPLIEAVRGLLDPLAQQVCAHTTVVFPFATALPLETLVAHAQKAMNGLQEINTYLTGLHIQPDGLMYLVVEDSARRLANLHQCLYSGPLSDFLNSRYPYVPHITVGRCTRNEPQGAPTITAPFLKTVKVTYRTLVLERILEDELSKIEATLNLGEVS